VRLPVDEEGFVDPELLEEVLRAHNVEGRHGRKRVRVVAVSGASNVLGSFNDLEALGRLAHAYGARLLVDGAQLVAHRRVRMAEEGIDCLAFSAHKAYAPFGSGGLVVRKGLLSLSREELEEARELGEENVAGIAALGRSLTLLERVGLDLIEEDEALLTARLLRGLASVPRLRVYGVRHPASPRFPQKGGVVAFSLDEVPHNLAAKLLAEYGGIGVRSGCFCAHLLVTELLRIHPLRVLAADMGLAVVPEFTKAVLPGLVRASLGLENDAEDVDRLIATLERIVAEPRSSLERFLGGTGNGLPRLPHTETEAQIEAFVKRAVAEVFDV
jgi:selenocysteine lyase/cysteine desulfurase